MVKKFELAKKINQIMGTMSIIYRKTVGTASIANFILHPLIN